MPPKGQSIRAVLLAAGFSAHQLRRISEHAFTTELPSLSATEDTGIMIDALVAHAERYDMLRELSAVVLEAAASSPAAQNMLFGDAVTGDGNAQAGNNLSYMLARLDGKVDQLLSDMQRQQREAEDMRRAQAALQQQVTAIDGRLSRYEARPTPWSARIAVAVMAIAMVIMAYWVLIGVRP